MHESTIEKWLRTAYKKLSKYEVSTSTLVKFKMLISAWVPKSKVRPTHRRSISRSFHTIRRKSICTARPVGMKSFYPGGSTTWWSALSSGYQSPVTMGPRENVGNSSVSSISWSAKKLHSKNYRSTQKFISLLRMLRPIKRMKSARFLRTTELGD